MLISEPGGFILLVGLAAFVLQLAAAVLNIFRGFSTKVSWFSGVLALTAALGFLASIVFHVFIQPVTPSPLVVLTGASVFGLVFGLVVFALERRNEAFLSSQSHGLLVLGLAAFTGVLVLFVPVLPSQFWPQESQILAEAVPNTVLPVTIAPSSTPRPSSTPTLVPSPTELPSPTGTLTPTATREPFSTRTPTPTATITGVCSAIVDYNLNLRTVASPESNVISVIPYSTIVDVGGRSHDGEWYFVEYNDQWGWVLAEYVSAEPSCADSPIID